MSKENRLYSRIARRERNQRRSDTCKHNMGIWVDTSLNTVIIERCVYCGKALRSFEAAVCSCVLPEQNCESCRSAAATAAGEDIPY